MFTRIFKSYINGRTEVSKSALVSYRTAGISSLSDYIDLSETGYKKNVIVYRCVQLISRALASVDWILQKSSDEDMDEVLYDHEILRLIAKPNMSQYKTTFIEEAVSYLLLSGNCYIILERDENDKPAGLYLLRPDRMRIIPGNGSFPLGYEYTIKKDFFK